MRACRAGIGRGAGRTGSARIGDCCGRRRAGRSDWRRCGNRAWISRSPCGTRICHGNRSDRRTGTARSAWVGGRSGSARIVRGTGICRRSHRTRRACRAGIGSRRRRRNGSRCASCAGDVVGRYGRGGKQRSSAEQQSVAGTHLDFQPSRPNTGRRIMPPRLPTKAAPNHNQPCTLPEAIPENSAPILQPNDSRAP